MLRAFFRLLSAVHDHPGTPPVDALTARVDALERAETLRAAEHAAMVDQLDRLYKRVSTRIAREHKPDSPAAAEESPLSLRRRLRG